MRPAYTEMRVKLISKVGKWSSYDLDVPYPPTPAGIIDAINIFFKEGYSGRSTDAARYRDYERITFEWDNHEINLSNPANDGQDPHPYFAETSEGYKWTKQFLGGYFTAPEKKEDQGSTPSTENQTTPESITPNPTPNQEWIDHLVASRDTKSDWQARWDAMMTESRRIAWNDKNRDMRRKEADRKATQEYTDAMASVKTIIDVPQAILRILTQMIKMFAWTLQMIPEEIQAATERFANNVSFIGLSVERLWIIANEIFRILTEWHKILSQLDWQRAAKLVNMWLSQQEKILKDGIEAGVIDENGDPAGLEKWRTPVSARPNDPEELKAWLAVSALAHSPLIGQIVQDQMRFQILSEYMARTGVGIPDQMAWQKYILGNGIGVTTPIQEVADMAGQIPDWFMQHSDKFGKIAKEIHAKQHAELELLKK